MNRITIALLLFMFLPNLTHAITPTFLERVQLRPIIAPKKNPRSPNSAWIHISIPQQTLTLFDEQGYSRLHVRISSAKNGLGEIEGSYQTPRGWHTICDKVGDGAPIDTILYRQKITPWRYTPQLHTEYPEKDWILTRILWLCGLEEGKNRGQNEWGQVVDSYQRLIYIHGAGSHVKWGTPTSRGCIRMPSLDILELFPIVENGLEVFIDEHH